MFEGISQPLSADTSNVWKILLSKIVPYDELWDVAPLDLHYVSFTILGTQDSYIRQRPKVRGPSSYHRNVHLNFSSKRDSCHCSRSTWADTAA